MTDLSRFHEAQARVWDAPLRELREGAKRSHWMWFVFPQLRGLGRSPMALRYGIRDLQEARDYLADPVLGPRLIACAEALLTHPGKTAEEIMGPVDALKLRSSATLFDRAGGPRVFSDILERFHGGEPCPLTMEMTG